MSFKKLLSLLFILILAIFSRRVVYAVESSFEQTAALQRHSASDDLTLNEENNSDISPTPRPAWMGIPIVAGDSDGVYMRAKTNKQTYAVGEIIYITVYVSGLNINEDDEKEVLIRAEGQGVPPVALNARAISGTASGVVAVVASRTEAVKIDIILEYGDNKALAGSIPLTFNPESIPAQTPSSNSQTLPVNIELIDGGKKGGGLPKTSDINLSYYTIGSLSFIVMVICLVIVSQLVQKRKSSRNTISSLMYDRGYIHGGRMDIYSKKEDLNEE